MSERWLKALSVLCVGGCAVFLGAALWTVLAAPAGDSVMRSALAAYAGLVGLFLGAAGGYIAGRRSAREELAAAQMAWAVQNAAPDRDELAEVALDPERTGEQRKVVLYDQDAYESFIDPMVPPGNFISGGRPVVMTGTRDVEAQDRELSDVYGIATWSGAAHLQADPPADETGEGTVRFMTSGEWAPATPAPKRVGQ